jgi:hypothetical protein
MTRKEVSERITDYYEGVFASFEARELQAHPATCDVCHTSFGQSRHPNATLGKIPEPSPLSARGKLELSAAVREEQSTRSRSMLRGPREIAAITVRVVILLGIIWFVIMWTGIAAPTQRYPEYAVDFSRQLQLRGGSSLPSPLPAVIPRARLDLVIHLGPGNQPGPYDVVLVQDGMRYASALGTTKPEDHEPILRVKLNLSQVPSGESRLGIRPAGQQGQYYKIVLK